jgi:excinuclease UvrABC nuclease subunit
MTTIVLEQVKPSDLPSVPLEQRKTLPECPGIYFAIDNTGIIQYIGRSNNIRQRWLQHHRQSQLEAIGSIQVAWLQVSDSLLLPSIEAALIEYFQPLLNNQISTLSSSQLNIRVNAGLYQKYKTKLRDSNTSITKSIENYMREYLAGSITYNYVADLARVVKDIEMMKKKIAFLKQAIETD